MYFWGARGGDTVGTRELGLCHGSSRGLQSSALEDQQPHPSPGLQSCCTRPSHVPEWKMPRAANTPVSARVQGWQLSRCRP